MKETPIIMSGNHPRLILDGIKTQTRRTYGLVEVNDEPDAWEFKRLNNGAIALFWRSNITEEDVALCKCPYGQVGDRLWVRESIEINGYLDLYYKADNYPVMNHQPNDWSYRDAEWQGTIPSIHMSKWMARIWLEITEVRAERVQEISLSDCLKEGIELEGNHWNKVSNDFIRLWNSLNAKRGYGWGANPWVWVVSFKVIK